jgi:hypothetical protein
MSYSVAESELLTEETVLRRMQGAISYECWTELDFNNELNATDESDNMAADHKSQS